MKIFYIKGEEGNHMTVGKRIQQLRKQANLTQEQLAEKLSVSRQAVSKWESDFNQPDIKTLIALAEIFEVTVDDLVRYQEESEEEIVEINVSDENVLKKQEEILKVHKKNHRLLVFIVSIIVILLIIFIICPIMGTIGQTIQYNKENEIHSHINDELEKQALVGGIYIQADVTDFEKQMMKVNGNLSLMSSTPFEEKTLTLIYEDQTKEIIQLITDGYKDLSFEKDIQAKNIIGIEIKLDKAVIPIENVDFKVSDYLYGVYMDIYPQSLTEEGFSVHLDYNKINNNSDNFIDPYINIGIMDEADPIDYISNIKISIYQDNQVIYEQSLETLEEVIEIPKTYNKKSRYKVKLTYQTPLQDYQTEADIGS